MGAAQHRSTRADAPSESPATPLQVLQFVKGEEYARFTRIVFDTAPTGHTLRLLTVRLRWGVGSGPGWERQHLPGLLHRQAGRSLL